MIDDEQTRKKYTIIQLDPSNLCVLQFLNNFNNSSLSFHYSWEFNALNKNPIKMPSKRLIVLKIKKKKMQFNNVYLL